MCLAGVLIVFCVCLEFVLSVSSVGLNGALLLIGVCFSFVLLFLECALSVP